MDPPALSPPQQSPSAASAGPSSSSQQQQQQQQQDAGTPDLKRKRQPRNSACQGCAALKMKCISTDKGKCERCLRMDRDCVPSIPKPRKRRAESSAGLDAAEGMSTLEFVTRPSSLTAPEPPPRFDPPDLARLDESLLTSPDLTLADSKSFITLFCQGLGNFSACEELLPGVDHDFVARGFAVFKTCLAPHFPFVVVPPGVDVIQMVARRPALTLAICTVTAVSYPQLRDRLSLAFQYALSAKAILRSERHIDTLTGLLIYLSWHHHHLTQQQVYQKLSLLAAMAADLGLYHSGLETQDPISGLERDRAFVGCYYLCTVLSATGFDKPSPLRWTPNLRVSAENASASGNASLDRSLISILELAHAIGDMEDALRQDILAQQPNALFLVNLQARATTQRLNTLRREHPTLGTFLGYTAALVHVYQRLFRVADTLDHADMIPCLVAIKEYFDDLNARPPVTLHHVTIVDWTYLLEIMILMARVSSLLPTTGGWESGALPLITRPETVLNSICSRMATASPGDSLSPRHELLLEWLRRNCQSIKARLLRKEGSGGQLGVTYDFRDGILDAKFWDSLTEG